jgi:hypothetical protein
VQTKKKKEAKGLLSRCFSSCCFILDEWRTGIAIKKLPVTSMKNEDGRTLTS